MSALTFALVGLFGGGASPRPVEVERLAFLAVASGRVVAAVAAQLPAPVAPEAPATHTHTHTHRERERHTTG